MPDAILLVEDDPLISAAVAADLRTQGFEVELATDGQTALQCAQRRPHRLLIVDRMVPRLDGLRVVRELRALGLQVPVLFLTTLGGIDDRVAGLEAGGDDYLVKPFAMRELIARVRALIRRPATGAHAPTQLQAGDLHLDLLARTASRSGIPLDLLPLEFKLLEFLARHTGQVVTRAMLRENVWNMHFDPRTSVMESHISRLRTKLAAAGGPDLIHTIRGVGYRLGPDRDAA